jgi:hypothetical protein
VPAVSSAFSCTLAEAITARNAAYKEHKAVTIKDAIKMRQNFQGTLAEAIALKNNSDVETEAKKLRTQEKQRRQGRNVKRMLGKLGNGGVTKRFCTDEDGTRVQCDTQQSMELACFEENETRFSQSEKTPPMLPPTIDELLAHWAMQTPSKKYWQVTTSLRKEPTSTWRNSSSKCACQRPSSNVCKKKA